MRYARWRENQGYPEGFWLQVEFRAIIANFGGFVSEAFIPEGTEWFIGELVEEFKAAHQAESLVHINTILIKADSPEMAYEKALAFGGSANRVFTNTDGVDVAVRFRGLRGLYAVYDRLEDGAELLYEECDGVGEEAIAGMVKPKEALAVFKPVWGAGGRCEP